MGEWIERRGMRTPRHDLADVAVEDRIFAISGADDLEVFDVRIQRWSALQPMPPRSPGRRRRDGLRRQDLGHRRQHHGPGRPAPHRPG